jgi:hypothetical protein
LTGGRTAAILDEALTRVVEEVMRDIAACLLILSLVGMTAAADPDGDALIKGTIDDGNKLVAILKSIKDKKGAEAARAKLRALTAALDKKGKQFAALPKARQQELLKKYRAEMTKTGAALSRERDRLAKVEGVAELLDDVTPFNELLAMRRVRALLQILALDQAVATYKVKTGEWPRTLKALSEPLPDKSAALVKAKDLLDPWKRPFQYDPAGPRNKGKKPDIWSLGPPNRKDNMMGNWPAEKKKEKKKPAKQPDKTERGSTRR